MLPGAAYAEKHGTYVNTEGRVQRGEKAAFPPGEAREDWAILRAVSQLAGKTLPFDSFDQLREQMFAEYPQLAREGLIDLPWSPPKLAAKAEGPDPLPDRGLLPDQRDLPRQPDDAPLLRRAGAGRRVPGGGGVTETSSQHWGMSYDWAWFIATIIGILVIALPLMLAVAMIIYAERKIWAAIALRRGPNVVGPWGLLQSFADGLKVFLKETIIPTSANKGLFLIAPIVTFTVALIVWAVVPFAPGVVLANVNVGLLYILAASSLGVYGVIVAGWASNSKYPFFSALRAAAQMVSYEVSIGFVLISVVLYAGHVQSQRDRGCADWFRPRHRQRLRVQPSAVPDVGGVLHQLDGRDLPHPLRPGRSGERARRRAPDRIFVDELRALLARRICQRHPDVRAQCHPVLGRLASAGELGAALPHPRHHLAVHQDELVLLHVRLGEGDGPALSLRPADAARLEDLPAAEPASSLFSSLDG